MKLDIMFLSDEAWFMLSGYVNAQNNRYGSQENPHQFLKALLHVEKIGVWADVSRRSVVGPIFHRTRVTDRMYYDIITQFISLLIMDARYCTLQQDGATAHTAQETTNMYAA